jgi:AcrR family transcriptional regulator
MLYNGNFDAAPERSSGGPSPAASLTLVARRDPRRRILDAIVAVVARRGYDRTTVSRVLAEAEVAEAVFSEHFHDKHDCFMQAIDELMGAAERRAREQFERPVVWSQRVCETLSLLLGALANDPDGARVIFVEMLCAGPAPQERHRRALSLFVSLMEEGRSHAGEARLPAQISEAVVGGIASILHRRVLQGETATLPSLHGDLAYFALLPYLDEERALKEAQVGGAT